MINSSIENIIPALCKLERIVLEISGLWDFSFQSFTFLPLCNKIISRTSRYLPFVALAALYGFFFINSLSAENAQALSNPQLKLADLAQIFADPKVMATGWTHYLVMDLFVGRWIYWEGQRTGVWTIHSLALCLFAGPLGLLSHILTSAIVQKFLTRSAESQVETATTSS